MTLLENPLLPTTGPRSPSRIRAAISTAIRSRFSRESVIASGERFASAMKPPPARATVTCPRI